MYAYYVIDRHIFNFLCLRRIVNVYSVSTMFRGVPRGVSRGFRKPLLDFTTTSASQIVYQLYLTKTISIIGKNLTIQ